MGGVYTVSFFGHRIVQRFNDADDAVYGLICALLREKETTGFFGWFRRGF